MPGCYLQIVGAEFDPESFLPGSSLQAYDVWHQGEPMAATGPRSLRFHETSGFRCNVSDVCNVGDLDRELDGQIDDAIAFLSTHHESLVALANDPNVEDRRLDFGFHCRLDQENVSVQGEWLPAPFLQLVGELRIGVALSLYPAPDSSPQQ